MRALIRLETGFFTCIRIHPGYAKFSSRSHHTVIRVYDEAGNVIQTHERTGDFKET
jgi:hypothetical protein